MPLRQSDRILRLNRTQADRKVVTQIEDFAHEVAANVRQHYFQSPGVSMNVREHRKR